MSEGVINVGSRGGPGQLLKIPSPDFYLISSPACTETLPTPVGSAHPQVESHRSIFNSLSCPSVQRGLFMLLHFSLLGMSPFSPARSTQLSVRPSPPLSSPPKGCLPHPSPPFPLQLCVGSQARVWGGGGGGGCYVGACLMSLCTYSGLGEDGLGLGFLGRHHWTLLTVSTKTELLNANTQTKHDSLCLELCKKIFFSYRALTGNISMVPGGPGKPSAPGSPPRPGGPCITEETEKIKFKFYWDSGKKSKCLKGIKTISLPSVTLQ